MKMAASLDYHPQQAFGAIPHRRPLPSGANPQFTNGQADQFSHSRTRTTSSNVLPPNPYPSYSHPMASGMPQYTSRRTLSNATSSTTASSTTSHHNAPVIANNRPAPPSSYASSIRRSTSSRSGASQGSSTSYVALLRKQKATVWCDRAQHEDPRLLSQQRAAKARAQQEMVGGGTTTATSGRSSNSSSGLNVRSKIRHHGAVKASAYSGGLGTQGNLSGAGVPMRLSASEVDDDANSENGEDDRRYHQRNGSGRSSLGSQHRTQSGYFSAAGSVMPTPGGINSLTMRSRQPSSSGSTPPSAHSPVDTRRNSLPLSGHKIPEDETPVPDMYASGRVDYFASSGGNGAGSGSSSEERFGEVGDLHSSSAGYGQQHMGVEVQQQKKTSDELRRRGSVDDRTMTMSGVRLFVANPDMDSD